MDPLIYLRFWFFLWKELSPGVLRIWSSSVVFGSFVVLPWVFSVYFLPLLGDIFQLLFSIRIFFCCCSLLPTRPSHRSFFLFISILFLLHGFIHSFTSSGTFILWLIAFFSPSWHCLHFLWILVFLLALISVFEFWQLSSNIWPSLGWWLAWGVSDDKAEKKLFSRVRLVHWRRISVVLEGPVSVSALVLLQGSCWWVAKLCPTHCHSVDCSRPGSSVHGISQARILEWVAVSFSRGSSRSRDRICTPALAGGLLTCRWATEEAPCSLRLTCSLLCLVSPRAESLCVSPESASASGLFGDVIVASTDRICVAIWVFTACTLLFCWTQISCR